MDQDDSVRIEIKDLEQSEAPETPVAEDEGIGHTPHERSVASDSQSETPPTEPPGSTTATADALLRTLAETNPDQAGFTDPPNRSAFGLGEPGSYTFAQADILASEIASNLTAHGLKPGSIIAIQMPNIRELPVLLAAIWRARMIAVPLPMMWRLNEIHQAIAQIDPAAIITVGSCGGYNCAETICEAAAHHLSIRHIFCTLGKVNDGMTPIDGWFDTGAIVLSGEDNVEVHVSSPSDTAIMTWADGPSGPYPVPRTHGELIAAGEAAVHELRLTGEDAILNVYPLTGITSVGGHLMAALCAGASLYLHMPFDYEVFVSQLRDHGITFTAVPPAVVEAMQDRGDIEDARTLGRIGAIWPAPHAPSETYDFSAVRIPVIDIFCLGELALIMRSNEAGAEGRELPLGKFYIGAPPAPGDSSEVRPYLETRVRGSVSGGASDYDPRKLTGTLFVRGTTVPSGPFAIAGALSNSLLRPDAQGYLDTGIAACVDESRAGVFHCIRHDGLIYHGGSYVSADELDRLYSDFPEFLDAAAFSITDRIMGERIYAAVIPKPDTAPSLRDLKRFLTEKGVAPYKLPDQLVTVSAIPRNPEGAVQRERILGQI